MGAAIQRAKRWSFALVCAVAVARVAHADDRAILAAALDDRRIASSPAELSALGERAGSFGDASVRIAAWLFVAEALAERAARPQDGAIYASRALDEPSLAPVDRGRAVVVLVSARRADGDFAAAIALADREAAVAPGLGGRLRTDRRAARILSTSRWALALVGLGGLLGLASRLARERDAEARRALARQIFDVPVWLGAAAVALVAPALASAFDPAVDGAPFWRLALGMLLVHASLAAARRALRPALSAMLAVGSFVFVAAWAYLGSARPLPTWAAP